MTRTRGQTPILPRRERFTHDRPLPRIGGTLLASAALGSDASEAFLHERIVYLVTPAGRIKPVSPEV